MKINDSIKKTTPLGVETAPAKAGKSAEKPGVSNNASSDSVHISSQLQALAGQLSDTSVFDTSKVNEIKAAIASGHFQVNAEKVADGLMDTVKDLIHARKG